MNRSILAGRADGPVLASPEGLSFWGGVDPASGTVIDAHHPLHGRSLAGAVLAMPTSRGSCTGSGVLLELIRNGHAPAALVFTEAEEVLTLGAIVARHLFGATLPVLRLDGATFAAVTDGSRAVVEPERLRLPGRDIPLAPPAASGLALTAGEQAMLDGADGEAVAAAMAILTAFAAATGAERLIPVTRVHIDGCLYAGPAFLDFAETFVGLGGRVRVPTTTNAISVDRANWRRQGTPAGFGEPAARLADAYVAMGAAPSFTCAPYLLAEAPRAGEVIAWAESNAAIFANSVLGARTAKHPDFLDLCIALTGRAALTGPYLDEGRAARRILAVQVPDGIDDAFWPLLGHLAGERSPDRVPLLTGLDHLAPGRDDLRALCAAFGTTSAAPMLHIAGVTPEAGRVAADADTGTITLADLADAWDRLDTGPDAVDLVAIGSPHASLDEIRAFAALVDGRAPAPGTTGLVTTARATLERADADGLTARLAAAGVRVVADLCWCTISEPVFPPAARTLVTSSGKYAHYAPGLSGRAVRFASLAGCATALATGLAPGRPAWLPRSPKP